MIRLIATDMDGTLLIHGLRGIPKQNLRALKRAEDSGVHVALCSGRMPEDMSFYASDAGLQAHILALNGSYCLDAPHGTCVSDRTMRSEDAMALRRLLDRYPGLHYEFFGADELVINAVPSDDWEVNVGTHLRRPGGKTRIALSLAEGMDLLLARGVNKLVVVDEAMTGVLEQIRREIARNLPGVEVSSSWCNNLEIMPRGVNKGAAVQALAQRLGIPMDQVMTLGDNENDIPMLACAGVGVAVENATPGALAAARYRVASNERFGVAEAVRRFVLNEGKDGKCGG